jgi:hypothetical protein
VDGFRITGGQATANGGFGGGVMVHWGAGATISNNRIDGNFASNAGGGVAVSADNIAPSIIINNAIFNNRALGVFGVPGGASAALPQQGSEPGGGIMVLGGPVTVTNNLVYSNTSRVGGDGMAILNGGAETDRVYHNTVVDNGSVTSTAVCLGTPGPIFFSNNLLVGHGTAISGTGAVLADYNGFYANGANYMSGLTPGAHDITGNPLFANRAGRDYHISLASPMAGAGATIGVNLDYEASVRPLPAGSRPDIGAYEMDQRRTYLPLVMRN